MYEWSPWLDSKRKSGTPDRTSVNLCQSAPLLSASFCITAQMSWSLLSSIGIIFALQMIWSLYCCYLLCPSSAVQWTATSSACIQIINYYIHKNSIFFYAFLFKVGILKLQVNNVWIYAKLCVLWLIPEALPVEQVQWHRLATPPS